MVCNRVHGIPAINQMLERNEKNADRRCSWPPPDRVTFRGSLVLAVFRGSIHQCPGLVRGFRSPMETRGRGEEGRGGWAARRGPRTTSRLQIALFARVSGHAVKVFNGILPLLRSLEASSRESRSVAPLSSVVLISPFFKTVSLLILLKWSKYNVFVIYRIFISSSYILPCPGKFHYFGGILLLVIKKNYYSITLKKNRTRSWTQGK